MASPWLVNNTTASIHDIGATSVLRDLVADGSNALPDELADIFTLTVLVGFNSDGSNRGILNWA